MRPARCASRSARSAPGLEGPQYTRPEEFRGWRVPGILLSGDHGRIEAWDLEQSRLRTEQARPDLLQKA